MKISLLLNDYQGKPLKLKLSLLSQVQWSLFRPQNKKKKSYPLGNLHVSLASFEVMSLQPFRVISGRCSFVASRIDRPKIRPTNFGILTKFGSLLQTRQGKKGDKTYPAISHMKGEASPQKNHGPRKRHVQGLSDLTFTNATRSS